jgi:hypothetical protein
VRTSPLLSTRGPFSALRPLTKGMSNSRFGDERMPLAQLPKSQWQSYFDRVSSALSGKQVDIVVTGLGLVHQIEAHWMPLIRLSYDATTIRRYACELDGSHDR